MLLNPTRNGTSILLLVVVPLLILISWWSYPSVHFRTPAYQGLPNLNGNTGQNPPTVGYNDNKDVNLGLAPVNTEPKKSPIYKEEDRPNKQPDPIAPIAPVGDEKTDAPKDAPPPPPSASTDAPIIPDSLDKWHIIKSASTKNGSYFNIDFHGLPGINPNIIPHANPNETDTYVVVAQRHKLAGENPYWTTELVCEALFKDDLLKCKQPASTLPISATPGGKCKGNLAFLDIWNIGPHDARVLHGPDRPFIVFGSNSKFSCFGQFIQDFRMLLSWPVVPHQEIPFRYATELQRPSPYGIMEKNWFPFWYNDTMYIHHDVHPKRVFAELNNDGSVGTDLAPQSAKKDEACIKSFFPPVSEPQLNGLHKESIHQGTNSLAVIMCDRGEKSCNNGTDNTYIMHIFQHKTYRYFHSVYEPYVMLFRSTPPFDMYAVGKKPLWINGRKRRGENEEISKNQTEMMYVTSMNWQRNGHAWGGNGYLGYLDDVLMVGFGIEDRRTAGMDVSARNLIGELNYCK